MADEGGEACPTIVDVIDGGQRPLDLSAVDEV
jgi:hypothetical protein